MFDAIKLKISHYILKKELLKVRREKKIVTLSNVKSVGVLFDATSSKAIKEIKSLVKYLVDQNIDVNVLGFIKNTKKDNIHIATIHINYFNLNDVTLLGIPSSKKTTSFLEKKYDMLINLSLINSFQTKYLALLSVAQYKVGVYDDNTLLAYDLMFRLKIKSLNYFRQHVIHYLELINNNNNEK